MTNLEKAAIAYASAEAAYDRTRGFGTAEIRCAIDAMNDAERELLKCARAFAASLDAVAPGLDPTPKALAREVLEAAGKATARSWFVGDSSIRGRAFCKVSGPLLGETRQDEDAAFIVTACNAAETLARAVLDGEEREKALRDECAKVCETAARNLSGPSDNEQSATERESERICRLLAERIRALR